MDHLSQATVQKAAQGDISAFEEIYRAYASFVYNVAYRMVAVPEDAEEVTQEVFLIVHRKLNSFMFRSSLKTWVYRITANCAINLLNKKNQVQKGRVDEFEAVLEFTAGEANPREHIEAEDQKRTVEALLDALNPDERVCMVLRNIQGLSYEEIANSLNMNINTVRTKLKRGREKLLKVGKEVVHDDM